MVSLFVMVLMFRSLGNRGEARVAAGSVYFTSHPEDEGFREAHEVVVHVYCAAR